MSREVRKLHPAIVANECVRLRTNPGDETAHRQTGAPLSSMALWKRPLLIGDNMWYPTLAPPVLAPAIVTRSGLPLNSRMFSRIQRKAITWSFIPKLPGIVSSSVLRNPLRTFTRAINRKLDHERRRPTVSRWGTTKTIVRNQRRRSNIRSCNNVRLTSTILLRPT